MTTLHVTPTPGETATNRIVNLTQADLTEKKRHRKIEDLAGFVAFLKKWGDPTKATIYWLPSGATALLNEEDIQSGRGDQDTVDFAFTRPLVARRWLDIIGNVFGHKEFKEFLELRHNEIEDGPKLYALIANLSLAQTFTYDAKLDNDQTYTIAYKSEGGADVAKLPKHIEVNLPLIEGLSKPFLMKLRLKFRAPQNSDETPTFQLLWDDQDDVLEEAGRAAIAAIGEGLDGWLLVKGKPNIKA